MAEFTSDLFRGLAEGPDGVPPGGPNWVWTEEQRRHLQRSKDLLFRLVMLRAARHMELTNQNDNCPEELRVAEAPLTITITSRAAFRGANGPQAKNHDTHHPFFRFMTDPVTATDPAGLYVSELVSDDDLAKDTLKLFCTHGMTCPELR